MKCNNCKQSQIGNDSGKRKAATGDGIWSVGSGTQVGAILVQSYRVQTSALSIFFYKAINELNMSFQC